MPFLFNEDDALFQTLTGITVSDGTAASASPTAWGTRKVGIFFDMPDKELRDAAYPFLILDWIGVREATERTHRGTMYYDSGMPMPEGARTTVPDPGAGKFYSAEWPTPVDITYQISVYSRFPQHDRQIMAQILWEKIPFHFGVAVTTNDNRVRRLVLQDIRRNDRVEGQKRIYQQIYTVVMSSEIPNTQLVGLFPATNVFMTSGSIDNTVAFQAWDNNSWQQEFYRGNWNTATITTWQSEFTSL